MDTQAAQARFTDARVARLATVTTDGAAHVVPCCFAVLDNGTVVSAVDGKPKSTAALRRLDNIAANPRVSLVVDHYDDDWSNLWWVRLDGVAEIIHAGDAYEAALDALVANYEQYRTMRPTGAVIAISPTQWRSWSGTPDL
ncbi:MAG: TIGR03668 family PPOX class F420-dependent oxidoreductase [Acidimicrobiaceae bacterium]|nr:TIGR03668 family PPOX class F420-dependent oxidoreductase [Acidimicrobiaceae bacterium]